MVAAASVVLGFACGDDPTQPGQGKVKEVWFQPQAVGFPYPAPVADGNTAYFASGFGFVIARDITTGAPKWTTLIGQSEYSSSPEIEGENFILRDGVLISAVEFHTAALDALTGKQIWKYTAPLDTIDATAANPARPGYVVTARMAADDNMVFIPAWGASVSAVDIKTGQAKWVWRVDPTISFRSGANGVGLSGDTAFVSVWHFLDQLGVRSEAWVVALDKATGKELWRTVLPKQSSGTMINCAPRIWNNLVIVTIGSGDLFAIDRRDQHVEWHIPTQTAANGVGTALITGAEVRNDVVYANGSDQRVHAYNAADGSQIWSSDAGQLTKDLLVTDKFIYATNSANLFIFDRSTGKRYAALGSPRRTTDFVFTSGAGAEGGHIFATLNFGAWSFVEP